MHKSMHVRICGSRGGAIPHGHPARATPWGPEHNQVAALKGRNSQGPGMPQPCMAGSTRRYSDRCKT